MRYTIIFLLLIFTASLFSAETNKMQIVGNGQKVDNEFVDKKKKDSNAELCAGLQIETDLVGLSFESDNGIVSKDEKPGFYILYLSAEERKVTVLCSGFEPLHIILRNYGIGLEKGGFYKIKVTGDKKVGDIPVNIISSPAGATLFVDGVDYGAVSMAKLKSGKHKIVLAKEGFKTIEENIEISQDKNLFNYTLTEIDPVLIKINSEPDGAAVYLNGTKIGITPLKRFYPEGKYKIKIEKDLFEPIEDDFIVQQPQTEFNFNLKENIALLNIKTHPKAVVYLNDERLVNLTDIKLAPQFIELKAVQPRAIDKTIRMEVVKGQKYSIDLFPTIETGKIQIAVTPDDARVELSDEEGIEYSANGSYIFKNMGIGRYNLSATANGYEEYTEKIKLSSGDVIDKAIVLEKKTILNNDQQSFSGYSGYTNQLSNKFMVQYRFPISSSDTKGLNNYGFELEHSISTGLFFTGSYTYGKKDEYINDNFNFYGNDINIQYTLYNYNLNIREEYNLFYYGVEANYKVINKNVDYWGYNSKNNIFMLAARLGAKYYINSRNSSATKKSNIDLSINLPILRTSNAVNSEIDNPLFGSKDWDYVYDSFLMDGIYPITTIDLNSSWYFMDRFFIQAGVKYKYINEEYPKFSKFISTIGIGVLF